MTLGAISTTIGAFEPEQSAYSVRTISRQRLTALWRASSHPATAFAATLGRSTRVAWDGEPAHSGGEGWTTRRWMTHR